MDAVGEAMEHNSLSISISSSSNNLNDQAAPAPAIVKGKRTKRQRVAAPASSISSAELSSSATEEEEDMANCLILLAQGRVLDAGPEAEKMAEEEADADEKPMSRNKLAEAAASATANGKAAGVYVYQCKTCGKCFPSFQALGGHRTSHKKPKITLPGEGKKPAAEEDTLQISMKSLISKPVATSNNNNAGISTASNKPRVHECSICGSEFSSGQALGGHMRRHRPLPMIESSELKKEKNTVLSLDLNLPAPSDDGDCEEPPKLPSSSAAVAFAFETQQTQLVFSASALVDCHY